MTEGQRFSYIKNLATPRFIVVKSAEYALFLFLKILVLNTHLEYNVLTKRKFMTKNKEIIKQANQNDIARAIVILLIELDINETNKDSILRNIDLFDSSTGLGLIHQYWQTYNFEKIGLLYPCSSDLHLNKARTILLNANFQKRVGSGVYKPTALGLRVIEYLKNKYIKRVVGLTTVINVLPEIIDSFIKIAIFFLGVDSDGCVKDPHNFVYKVYNVNDDTFNVATIDIVLKEFSDYVEW